LDVGLEGFLGLVQPVGGSLGRDIVWLSIVWTKKERKKGSVKLLRELGGHGQESVFGHLSEGDSSLTRFSKNEVKELRDLSITKGIHVYINT
jgi:hypothetical protein